MPTFYYTAKSENGKTKTGTLEVKNEKALAQSLRRKGFVLTSVRNLSSEDKKTKGLNIKIKGLLGKVSLVEKVMFTRHLSVMIGAGFSIHKALETLAKQTGNLRFKKILRDLVNRIKKGESLASGMAQYPKVFNDFYVSMVKVGEKGGNLEEVLSILAKYLKREHEFRSKVRGAMVYPGVIVAAMIGIGILMMVVVMPKITSMFEELDVDLPFTTKVMIYISDFLRGYFLIVIPVLLVFFFFLFRLLKTKKGKKALSWFFLKFPFLSKITKKINCARFARSFSSLMESGVPIVESLKITSETVDNVYYSRSLISISEFIKKGKNIHESMEDYDEIYPILVRQMIGVGEETGELSDIMEKLAAFYEEEVENITENLASIIEPVLMIIIGAAVGFFAISMLQPMYSMMQGL
ncbi:MAG: hypothetical protein GF387_00240 [Candidatus Portnoybacteria bacterium]|nr:hypothetical protein [Candidatus Portnoybacteria bacterium]